MNIMLPLGATDLPVHQMQMSIFNFISGARPQTVGTHKSSKYQRTENNQTPGK